MTIAAAHQIAKISDGTRPRRIVTVAGISSSACILKGGRDPFARRRDQNRVIDAFAWSVSRRLRSGRVDEQGRELQVAKVTVRLPRYNSNIRVIEGDVGVAPMADAVASRFGIQFADTLLAAIKDSDRRAVTIFAIVFAGSHERPIARAVLVGIGPGRIIVRIVVVAAIAVFAAKDCLKVITVAALTLILINLGNRAMVL